MNAKPTHKATSGQVTGKFRSLNEPMLGQVAAKAMTNTFRPQFAANAVI